MTTDPRQRWRRIEALFAEAIELPPSERAAYLARATDDVRLATEVLDLVAVSSSAPDAMRDIVAREASLLSHEASGVRVGATLDGWHIVDKIGEGGMGAVYLAERGDTRAAVKVLLYAEADALARFRDEQKILGALDHAGIVRLRDVGKTPTGLPYLLMDHIDGVPLTMWAADRSIAERLSLFLQVCAAVQHAHDARVVHRDLKPSNILVTADGRAHLLDFGIAKLNDPDRHARTGTGMPLCTPEYASPEQVRGERVGSASDVYSLGVVLLELLTGQSATARRPSRGADVPAGLDAIVMKALAQDPADRHASVAALARELERHLAGEHVHPRRRWWLAIPLALLTGLGAWLAHTPAPAAARSLPTPELVAAEDPTPIPLDHADSAKGLLLKDADGGFYLVDPNREAPRIFYGQNDTFYEQFISKRFYDPSTKRWSFGVWAPSVVREPGTIARAEDGSYVRWCGSEATTLTPLGEPEAATVLARATFFSEALVRGAYLLARDDAGVYYYVDTLREAYGGGSERVFVGRPGLMHQESMTSVSRDAAGDVFATASGELRLVKSHGAVESVMWIAGDRRLPLTSLALVPNARLVYVELGIYPSTGTICEDH